MLVNFETFKSKPEIAKLIDIDQQFLYIVEVAASSVVYEKVLEYILSRFTDKKERIQIAAIYGIGTLRFHKINQDRVL